MATQKKVLKQVNKNLSEKLEIILESNFKDYYDDIFNSKEGLIWKRNQTATFTRSDMFGILKKAGNDVPLFGNSRDIIPEIVSKEKTEDINVVVYLDDYKHGDGSSLSLVKLKEAFDFYGNKTVANYFPITSSISYTYLKIGKKDFGVIFENKEDWRSNFGYLFKSKVACVGVGQDYHPKLPFAIFSIDYIRYDNKLYAVDFNLSPCLDKMGVRFFISPEEIYNEIKNAIYYFRERELNYV